MDFDPALTAMGAGEWLFEYVLRLQISVTDLETILLRLPPLPAPASPRLQKTFHLRRIGAEISSPPGLTLRTLQWLEQIEELDRETHHRSPSPAMRKAYCLLALHLTIPHPRHSFIYYDSDSENDYDDDDEGSRAQRFLDEVYLDWKSRISGLGVNKASWLCSQGLTEARRTMDATIAKPFPHLFRLMRRRERGRTFRAARNAVRAYVREAFDEMGPAAFAAALSLEGDDMVQTGQNQGDGSGSGSGSGSGRREKGHTSRAAWNAARAYVREAFDEMGPAAALSCEGDNTVPTGQNQGDGSGAGSGSATLGGTEDGPDNQHSIVEVSKQQEHNVMEDNHPGAGGTEDGPDHQHSIAEVSKQREHTAMEDDHLHTGGTEDGPDHQHSIAEVSNPREHNVVEEDHPDLAILGGTDDGTDHQHSMAEVSEPRHSVAEVSEPREHNVVEDDQTDPGRSEDEPSHHDSMPEVVEPQEHNGAEDDHPPRPVVGVVGLQSASLSEKPNIPNPNRSEIQMRKRPRISYFNREKKRMPWSAEEEETLREAILKYGEGNWKLIKYIYALTFVERTVVNIKDKWRNMKDKEEREKEKKEKDNKNKKRRRTR